MYNIASFLSANHLISARGRPCQTHACRALCGLCQKVPEDWIVLRMCTDADAMCVDNIISRLMGCGALHRLGRIISAQACRAGTAWGALDWLGYADEDTSFAAVPAMLACLAFMQLKKLLDNALGAGRDAASYYIKANARHKEGR